MVSIPAAYTATEIAAALKYGADYIKIFPADQITKEYVKAITAPLSDVKLLAVGDAQKLDKFSELCIEKPLSPIIKCGRGEII